MCFMTQSKRNTCMKIHIMFKNHPLSLIYSVSFCEVCTMWIVMLPNRICTRSQKFSNYAHTSGMIWMSLSWASKVLPFFIIMCECLYVCVFKCVHCLRCLQKLSKLCLMTIQKMLLDITSYWQQHNLFPCIQYL